MTLQIHRFQKYLVAVFAIVLVAISAEVTARIDDSIFSDTPFFANPDRQSDLLVQDALGIRGRPGGAFERWRLNSFGFRGPEISKAPNAIRLILLGASETFGLYETDGHDYPTRLQKLLRDEQSKIEIVNAAMAGMALPTMATYWSNWVRNFGATAVLIYPSPSFYLDDSSPRERGAAQQQPADAGTFRSRILARVGKSMREYAVLRTLRAKYAVWRYRQQNADAVAFGPIPDPDRLREFTEDLVAVARSVQGSGATPILVTPAFKTPLTLEASDYPDLEYFRIFYPRATAQGIASFNYAAQKAVRQVGRTEGWQVIDAAAVLSGHRELFADPVHFNDKGSDVLARKIANDLLAVGDFRGKKP